MSEALDDWKRPAPIRTCGDGEEPLVALLELYDLNGQRPLPASTGRVCQLMGATTPWAEGQVEQALRQHFRPTRAGWVFGDQEPRSQEGRDMDGELMPEGLLGRVLGEVKAIQATALDDTPVWFGAQNIADACALPLETARQALGCLHHRGDVVMALKMGSSPRAKFVAEYALAEAVEASNARAEAR